MNIVFYDDRRRYPENELLSQQIVFSSQKKANVFASQKIEHFEKTMREVVANVFILDIMGSETDMREYDTGHKVSSSRIGIELLRRIRGNVYPLQDSKSLIFMRSARGESYIKEYCIDCGCDYFLRPGEDDYIIIESITKMINEK
jgi:hypothetical protein